MSCPDESVVQFFTVYQVEYVVSNYIEGCPVFHSRDCYPMILVANKVDLVHLRKVKDEQGRELAASLKVSYTKNMCKQVL